MGSWKENGNYYSILGLYGNSGQENGNYYSIFGLGYIGIQEKKMETILLYGVM